jgi:hypothetical protein
MKMQTDHEILTTLINQLTKSTNDEDRKTILTDLEFYLHQVCCIILQKSRLLLIEYFLV